MPHALLVCFKPGTVGNTGGVLQGKGDGPACPGFRSGSSGDDPGSSLTQSRLALGGKRFAGVWEKIAGLRALAITIEAAFLFS